MNDQELIDKILEHTKSMPFGSVNFTVFRHANKTVSLQINEYQNAIFKDNVEFADWLLNGLKSVADSKQTGPVNLSIHVKNGLFTKVTETRQKQYPKGGDIHGEKKQ